MVGMNEIFATSLLMIGIILAAYEDIRKLEISNYTIIYLLAVNMFLYFDGVMSLAISKIAIISGIIYLYAMRIIGEGDTKVFVLSALYIDEYVIMLAIISTLSTLLIVSKKYRTRVPLVTLFAIYLATIIVLENLEFIKIKNKIV